jgi:prepilin-type N-terminal cleavage/methylation domain-containing protein
MISSTYRNSRSGVTLIEVLVAIFVASIGLLALLALFPVGAISMKQALRDSRCALTAANAMALFKTKNIARDSALSGTTSNPFTDGYSRLTEQLGERLARSGDVVSYPVYVDPLGATVKTINALGTGSHLPVYLEAQANKYPRILRSGVSFIQPSLISPPQSIFSLYEKWFSLLDDISFDPTIPGQPSSDGVSFVRDPRYTFAYMLRQPSVQYPSLIDVTIVVYAGRAINSSMASYEETPCNNVVFNGTTAIVPYGTANVQPQRPNIKPGGWILDATMPDSSTSTLVPQGYFYRVIEVVDDGATLTLELQTPVRQNTNQGMAIFLDNVAEVFEKGTIAQ